MEQSDIPPPHEPPINDLTQRFNDIRLSTTQSHHPSLYDNQAGGRVLPITETPIATSTEPMASRYQEETVPRRSGDYGNDDNAAENNITPFSTCAQCQAIPFATLPCEDEPGYPHYPSLQALKESAKICMLCRLILAGVHQTRDEIDREHKGKETAGCWVSFKSTKLNDQMDGSHKSRMECTKQGAFCAGSNQQVSQHSGQEVALFAEPEPYAFPFEEDSLAKPYIYGNWWSYSKGGLLELLIGLGVRIGKSPLIEDGEGNIRDGFAPDGTLEDVVHHRGTHLRLRKRKDSPVKYVPGFLRHCNPSDISTFCFLQSWISRCNQHHLCEPKDTVLPTRVLDVGDNRSLSPVIRLVESGGKKARFTALSHCWGTSHRITLTKSTFGALQRRSNSTDHLPKTFAEAVSITRTLGIRYLWIDSLCIFQDDPEDWEREAANMAAVYENCYVCIAADSSTDDSTGCFPSQLSRTQAMYVSPHVLSLGLEPMLANAAPMMVNTPHNLEGSYAAMQPFATISPPSSSNCEGRPTIISQLI